jgi:magnesium transporter
VPIGELGGISLSPDDLLWVDLRVTAEDELVDVLQRLGLPSAFSELVMERDNSPTLRNYGDAFGLRANAARMDEGQRVQPEPLAICAGANVVLTAATATPRCVHAMRERQQQNIELGTIEAESFVVALLDAQLSTYYDGMAALEAEVEKLELTLLSRRVTDVVEPLRRLRQAASRLRRMLTAHRDVYGGLSRPDFRPTVEKRVNAHFAALDSRFERALDLAEHGRELVVGTFELFAARAAMSTNRTMQALTFITVLIGGLAVLVGVLGMNFEAPFFSTGARGFWTAVGAMLALSGIAVAVARRRGWI